MRAKFHEARYTPSSNPEYRGNPNIECLPCICKTAKEISRLFMYFPQITEQDRELEDFDRFDKVDNLRKFRMPFFNHIDLASTIFSCIQRGYNNSEDFFETQETHYSNEHEVEKGNDSGARTILIKGTSGVGKTTAVEQILSVFPQVILHSCYQGEPYIQTQIVYLKVDCPSTVSIKSFMLGLVQAFDEALDEEWFEEATRRRFSRDTLIGKVKNLVREYKLGILVIDEIQNLCSISEKDYEVLCNFFTTLTNEYKIPIVFIGTYKIQKLLDSCLRTTRRMLTDGEFEWKRLEYDDEQWNLFIEQMWRIQYTKSFTPLTEELKEAMYEHSQGIIAILISLFIRVQRRVILDGKNKEERIRKEDITKTAQTDFKSFQGILKAIKENDIDRLIDLEDLLGEVEKLNFNDSIKLEETRKKNQYLQMLEKEMKSENRKSQIISRLKRLDFFKDYSSRELERVFKDIPENNEDLDVLVAEALIREKERLKKEAPEQKTLKSRACPDRSLLSLLNKTIDSLSYKDCLDLGKIEKNYEL